MAEDTPSVGSDREKTPQLSISNDFINKNDLNILLLNARSLAPKLFSLVDTMHEMDSHIALVLSLIHI